MSQDYFREHISMSQWIIETGPQNKQALLSEEIGKGQRLEILNGTIGLPIVQTRCVTYDDISTLSNSFRSLLREANNSLYAVTAYPTQSGFELLRNRGQTLPDLISWLWSQDADHAVYEYCFEPHIEAERSCIFVVQSHRIIGEAALGTILQLSNGKPTDEPLYFEYNFHEWKFSKTIPALEELIRRAIASVFVDDALSRDTVENQLHTSLAENHLNGYFEAIDNAKAGLRFIEYNRALTNNLDIQIFPQQYKEGSANVLIGRPVSNGRVEGVARVFGVETEATQLRSEEILVCHFISPRYAHCIKTAAAVVADIGGIFSHPAITCRELAKPCVVGAANGTTLIRTGDVLEVDAGNGIVRIM